MSETQQVQIDEVLQKRFEVACATLKIDEKRQGSLAEQVVRDYVAEGSTPQKMGESLNAMSWKHKLQFHGTGALINAGVLIGVGALTAYGVSKFATREETAPEALENKSTDVFSNVEGVESTARPIRRA